MQQSYIRFCNKATMYSGGRELSEGTATARHIWWYKRN